jgi:hypothetical protein
MDGVNRNFLTKISMREDSKMGYLTKKEYMFGQMERDMKVSFLTDFEMGKDC